MYAFQRIIYSEYFKNFICMDFKTLNMDLFGNIAWIWYTGRTFRTKNVLIDSKRCSYEKSRSRAAQTFKVTGAKELFIKKIAVW